MPMVFSAALERLPSCSYAVERDGGMVNVWFLYRQDPEKLGDPMAESDPWVEVRGANVVRWGEEFGMHEVRDSIPAEDVPDRVREWEWTPTDRKDLPVLEDPDTVVYTLHGLPVEEAKAQEEWPEEIRALSR